MATVNRSEYREADEYNEAYMKPILEQIYNLCGFDVRYVNDKRLQCRGEDVLLTHRKTGQTFVVDEKCDTNRQLNANLHIPTYEPRDSATTFALELSAVNQDGVRRPGWFHPESRKNALNTHFALVWINCEKDKPTRAGKIQRVKQVEFCLISYDALKSLVESDANFSYDTVISDTLQKIQGKENEKVRFQSQSNNMYVFYSGQLKEKPINYIIPKDVIRDNALMGFAFNLEGENGTERLSSVRRTHFTKKHSSKQYKRDFVPIANYI